VIEFKGDVNNDGTIDVLDFFLAFQISTGVLEVDEDAINRADVDGSGSVSIDDVNNILDHIKGKKIIDGVAI
jgi:hypothetical protein